MPPRDRRRGHLLAAALVATAVALLPARAVALDFKIGKERLRLDITETLLGAAWLDDGKPDPETKNYGEIVNRLNAQLAWRNFLFMVRFDSVAWVDTPQPGDRSPYVSPPGDPRMLDCPNAPLDSRACVVQPPDEFGIPDPDLINRFQPPAELVSRWPKSTSEGRLPLGIKAIYLEKIALSYTGRNVEVTLGDFYVNFGRGMVLSLRKLDELGFDTTLTGARLAFRARNIGGSKVELSGVAVAGFTNIQNINRQYAQFIPDSDDLITGLHLDARLFDKVLVGGHAVWSRPPCLEGGPCEGKDFDYDSRLRAGALLDAPRLLKWLGVYAEYARRQDREKGQDALGDAFYGAVSVYAGRSSWVLEVKHYDNYRPLTSSVNPRNEIVYTQSPTLEQIITQISTNTDITAARLRAEVRVSDRLQLFWAGLVGRGRLSETKTTTLVDIYGGAQIRWDDGHSHFFPIVGYRHERANPNEEVKPPLHPEVEERLVSVSWDGLQVLPKQLSIEAQGLIWFREKPLQVDDPEDKKWREGFVQLALKWSPHLVASLGYEFTTNVQEKYNKHDFFNGQLRWNITSATSLTLFVGGNRPGLRCVSGVCAYFPAFQGARLEFTMRL